MKIQRVTEGKKRFLPLLLLADPDEGMIDKYLEPGQLYAELEEGEAVCLAVVLDLGGGDCELKNLATAENRQNEGRATGMLRYLFRLYAASGYRRMLVGTSESGVGFYERLGFVFSHREKDFFVSHYPEPVMENGRRCVDMLYLSRPLTGARGEY